MAGIDTFAQLPDRNAFRRQAAQEAVARLAFLKPSSVSTVERLLNDADTLHPKAICSAYRQEGTQLDDCEKRSLGIRLNAFMTHEALAELTDLGLNDPIRAHEITVLRASFSMSRHRNATSAADFLRGHSRTPVQILYDVFHHDSCTVCSALDGNAVGSDWGLFAPKECSCLTAPYGLKIDVDWIGGCIAEELEGDAASKPSIVEKFKAALLHPFQRR